MRFSITPSWWLISAHIMHPRDLPKQFPMWNRHAQVVVQWWLWWNRRWRVLGIDDWSYQTVKDIGGLAIVTKHKVDYWLMMLMAKNILISKFSCWKDLRIGCGRYNFSWVGYGIRFSFPWLGGCTRAPTCAPTTDPMFQSLSLSNDWFSGLGTLYYAFVAWHTIWSWVLPHAKASAQHSHFLRTFELPNPSKI